MAVSIQRALAAALFWLVASSLNAQDVSRDAATRLMFVNDEWERYTRVLQVAGDVPLYPWSVREFGPREIERLSATTQLHPWFAVPTNATRRVGPLSLSLLPAQAQLTFNSGFPYGFNDGPVWTGRGLTSALHGAAAARAGPVSAVFAPVVFRAENTRFQLAENGQAGPYVFGDAFAAHAIDQPQRFGDEPYARVDLGNSSVHVDAGAIALGLSTAAQHWGPSRDHPILLGNNAGGFPHVFLGSARPVDLWFARLHSRLFWGSISGSRFARIHETQPRRFATGIVGVVVPRGVPGLEIGAARFFHFLWQGSIITSANLLRPFEGLFVPNTDPRASLGDNQLASFFARWAFPEAGFEVYGEYGREDYNANLRDLAMEPDHDAAYMVGFQRTLTRGPLKRHVLRGELLNSRISGLVISREQSRFYMHLPVAQGHTSRGQVLGSIGGFGGGASTLAWDTYSPAGRTSVAWTRIMRAETVAFPSGVTDPQEADVQQAVGVSGIRFRGRMGLLYELTAVYELNRNFARDEWNARAATGVQYVW